MTKWHNFVIYSSISMLSQTIWQPLTRAIDFLPFDDSLSNNFPSTLFKLQRLNLWSKTRSSDFWVENLKLELVTGGVAVWPRDLLNSS